MATSFRIPSADFNQFLLYSFWNDSFECFFFYTQAGNRSLSCYGPVAQCRDREKWAKKPPACDVRGLVSIDDGSYSRCGDTLKIRQRPRPPYDIGKTKVKLTVTDSQGKKDTCTGYVTVRPGAGCKGTDNGGPEVGTPTELATFKLGPSNFRPPVREKRWVAGPDYSTFVCGAAIRLEGKQGLFGDDSSANGLKLMFCDINDWEIQRERLVVNGWTGSWGNMAMCPRDSYVTSMQIRFQSSGNSDDTAMNGLRLRCAKKEGPIGSVLVENGHFGDWYDPSPKPPKGKFVVAVKAFLQDEQGNLGDDVALVSIEYRLSRRRMCVTPYGYIDCFYDHPGKGCNDEICEAVVCGLDESCCEVNYDTFCVRWARNLCTICKI